MPVLDHKLCPPQGGSGSWPRVGWDEAAALPQGPPQHPGMLAQLSKPQLRGGMRVLWGAGPSCIPALSEALCRAWAASSSPLAALVVKKGDTSLCDVSRRADCPAQGYQIPLKSLAWGQLSSAQLTPPLCFHLPGSSCGVPGPVPWRELWPEQAASWQSSLGAAHCGQGSPEQELELRVGVGTAG